MLTTSDSHAGDDAAGISAVLLKMIVRFGNV